MKKTDSLARKKLARRKRRIFGLSKRKKVGLGWDSPLKVARTGFEPRTKSEARAHQMKLKKKVIK